jgi:hypothetical protein
MQSYCLGIHLDMDIIGTQPRYLPTLYIGQPLHYVVVEEMPIMLPFVIIEYTIYRLYNVRRVNRVRIPSPQAWTQKALSTNIHLKSIHMKVLNRSNIIKFIIISIMAVAFACLATSCESQSGRRAKSQPLHTVDTIIAAPIEHMPLWKCTMTFADSTVAETYTYAKDRYDADRTLTSTMEDKSYVQYKLDTVVVVEGILEDRR